jgi:hypothetical protein
LTVEKRKGAARAIVKNLGNRERETKRDRVREIWVGELGSLSLFLSFPTSIFFLSFSLSLSLSRGLGFRDQLSEVEFVIKNILEYVVAHEFVIKNTGDATFCTATAYV